MSGLVKISDEDSVQYLQLGLIKLQWLNKLSRVMITMDAKNCACIYPWMKGINPVGAVEGKRLREIKDFLLKKSTENDPPAEQGIIPEATSIEKEGPRPTQTEELLEPEEALSIEPIEPTIPPEINPLQGEATAQEADIIAEAPEQDTEEKLPPKKKKPHKKHGWRTQIAPSSSVASNKTDELMREFAKRLLAQEIKSAIEQDGMTLCLNNLTHMLSKKVIGHTVRHDHQYEQIVLYDSTKNAVATCSAKNLKVIEA